MESVYFENLWSYLRCCLIRIYWLSHTYFTYMNFLSKVSEADLESKAAVTSKMECFVIIVNGFQPLTIITNHSILHVAAVLDPSLKWVPWQLELDSESCFLTVFQPNNKVYRYTKLIMGKSSTSWIKCFFYD